MIYTRNAPQVYAGGPPQRNTYSVPKIDDINSQTPIEKLHKNLGAYATQIPLCYGTCQIGGIPFAVDYEVIAGVGWWTVGYALALGECGNFNEYWINGKTPLAGVGITYEYKSGATGQAANTILAANITGYTDTLVFTNPSGGSLGVCHFALRFPETAYSDFPDVIVEFQGKKVYDPDTTTTIFSESPALHIADFLKNDRYGGNYVMDWASVSTVKADCAALVGGLPRRQNFLILDQTIDLNKAIEIGRTYAGCFVNFRGGEVRLVSDRPVAYVDTINMDDIVAGTFKLRKKDTVGMPTVIRATWTKKIANKPWKERVTDPVMLTGVDTAARPWREQRINLVGVHSHAQANRECVERLNKLTLNDLSATWEQYESAMPYEAGDVIRVNHGGGLAVNKLFRIVKDPQHTSDGFWRIHAEEYDPAMYSDGVVSEPTTTDGVLPKDGVPSAPTGGIYTSKITQLTDGTWSSAFRIQWTAPTDGSLITGYFIVVQYGGEVKFATIVPKTQIEVTTSPLVEGLVYTVSVATLNGALISASLVGTPTLSANTALPAVPGTTTTAVQGTVVTIKWLASASLGVEYEVRYWPTAGGAWGTSYVVVDRVKGLIATAVLPTTVAYTVGVKSVWVTNGLVYSATNTSVSLSQLVAGSVKTWYQPGVPVASAAGDIWIDTDSVPANHPYRATNIGDDAITAGEWVSIKDATADGKNTVFRQDAEPTGMIEGDIWIDTNDNDQIYVYNGSLWVINKAISMAYVYTVTTKQAANFNAVAQYSYPIDCSLASRTMTLPGSPASGTQVYFFDSTGDFDRFPFIIARNGLKILELSEDLTVDVRYFSGGLQYIDATIGWTLI